MRTAVAILLLASSAACSSKEEAEYEPLRTRISWRSNSVQTEGTILSTTMVPGAIQAEVQDGPATIKLTIPRWVGTFTFGGCANCNGRDAARLDYSPDGSTPMSCGGTVTVTRASSTVTTGTFTFSASDNNCGPSIDFVNGSFNLNH